MNWKAYAKYLWAQRSSWGVELSPMAITIVNLKEALDEANRRALAAEKAARAWKTLAKDQRAGLQGLERALLKTSSA